MLFRLLWLQYIDPFHIFHIFWWLLSVSALIQFNSIQLRLQGLCFKCSFLFQVSLPHSRGPPLRFFVGSWTLFSDDLNSNEDYLSGGITNIWIDTDRRYARFIFSRNRCNHWRFGTNAIRPFNSISVWWQARGLGVRLEIVSCICKDKEKREILYCNLSHEKVYF